MLERNIFNLPSCPLYNDFIVSFRSKPICKQFLPNCTASSLRAETKEWKESSVGEMYRFDAYSYTYHGRDLYVAYSGINPGLPIATRVCYDNASQAVTEKSKFRSGQYGINLPKVIQFSKLFNGLITGILCSNVHSKLSTTTDRKFSSATVHVFK